MLCSLICPFTGSQLKIDVLLEGNEEQPETAILRSAGHRFPVVAGIPILKADAPTQAIIALIEARRAREALAELLSPPLPDRFLRNVARAFGAIPATRKLGRRIRCAAETAWRARTESLLAHPCSVRELLAHYFLVPGQFAENFNYFFYRFGQPRHLVALSFATLVDRPTKPVLDLGCGIGTITRYLQQRAAPQRVIGLDQSFHRLYIARTLVSPESLFVCAEADGAGLPFADQALGWIFTSDAFHYLTNKFRCILAVKRIAAPDATIALVTLRSERHRHVSPGLPLAPEAYEALLADWPHRVVSEAAVLERYLARRGPALATPSPWAVVQDAPIVDLVASRDEHVFRDYGEFPAWPHGEGRLGLNPLYRRTRVGDPTRFTLSFPSAYYEEENRECRAYLRAVVDVREAALAALERGERTDEVEGLVNRFVMLAMPERWAA